LQSTLNRIKKGFRPCHHRRWPPAASDDAAYQANLRGERVLLEGVRGWPERWGRCAAVFNFERDLDREFSPETSTSRSSPASSFFVLVSDARATQRRAPKAGRADSNTERDDHTRACGLPRVHAPHRGRQPAHWTEAAQQGPEEVGPRCFVHELRQPPAEREAGHGTGGQADTVEGDLREQCRPWEVVRRAGVERWGRRAGLGRWGRRAGVLQGGGGGVGVGGGLSSEPAAGSGSEVGYRASQRGGDDRLGRGRVGV
jgi:hypothetical protein